MKKLIQSLYPSLLVFLIVLTGCTLKADPQLEMENAEKVLKSYFDGISSFDYQKMRDACSPDYALFEDGIIWTVDDHINFLKSMEGKGSISYSFIDINKSVEGSIAWITHRNIAEAVFEGNPMRFEWLESAIFKQIDGSKWKMVHLHSTTVKPTESQ